MLPSVEQLRVLYQLIQEHQLSSEPLVRAQMLAEGTLRVTFGPALACVEGLWFIDREGYERQYDINAKGEIV
ncbi:MAG: hypothetical protein KME17_02720 [Cyanosarcina radialis HA8281-LM2]|jgi:hypothetical protein|nr:hypothetical protein [Cyanosarcina radialis HA8281-LM2]